MIASIKAFLNTIPHWVLAVLAAGLGASIGYLEQQSPVSLLVALQHWSTLEPILEGAIGAGVTMIVGMLRREPWLSSGPGAVSTPDGSAVILKVPPPPPVQTRTRRSWRFLPAIVLGAIVLSVACTPAETATFTSVEQTVLTALENGTALALIETEVKSLVPAGADVDAIINEAITLLHDLGVLPPNVEPVASAVQTEAVAKVAAHKAASK